MKNSLLVIGNDYVFLIPSSWENIYYLGRIDSMEYENQLQEMWMTVDDVVQSELLGAEDEFE